jgi:ComF family protein
MMDEPIAEMPSRFQRLQAHGQSIWRRLVDVVTPPLCLSCRVPVTEGASLCLACWQKLQFIDDPVCDVLGTPFAYDEGEGAVSPAAIANPPGWDRARAAVAFDEASKHLIHLLKYRDTQEAGLAMARIMAGAGRTLLAEADLILPVPLHRKRLWERRFNQAAVLAASLSVQAGKPWHADVLQRINPTTSQVGLTAEERRKNVRRAFDVPMDRRHVIDGKTVLLVDDVRTTGATASACAETLRKAGAAHIDVLSFALVLGPVRLHIEA